MEYFLICITNFLLLRVQVLNLPDILKLFLSLSGHAMKQEIDTLKKMAYVINFFVPE